MSETIGDKLKEAMDKHQNNNLRNAIDILEDTISDKIIWDFKIKIKEICTRYDFRQNVDILTRSIVQLLHNTINRLIKEKRGKYNIKEEHKMSHEFYEDALVTFSSSDETAAHRLLSERMHAGNLGRCFVAVFDPEVDRAQMIEEIIEAVKFL